MSEIELRIELPLDDGGFLRRECPLCRREFKVLVGAEELDDLASHGLESFLLDEDTDETEQDPQHVEGPQLTCPYCGQQAESDNWWTEEQLAYVRTFAENIVAEMANKQLIRPLKRRYGGRRSGIVSISFEGNELPVEDPWISPGVNDMEVFNLPCCGRQIKVDEGWSETVHCHFCGFPHSRDLQDD